MKIQIEMQTSSDPQTVWSTEDKSDLDVDKISQKFTPRKPTQC